MLDVLIKNGNIVDGSGKPGYPGDIAVKDGKIQKIAPSGIRMAAARVIDAGGRMVTPGFIDCHNHSDCAALLGSDSYNFLEQGVTTMITGQCGVFAAPYYPGALLSQKAYLSEERFRLLTRQTQTVETFFKEMQQVTIGTNMAFFAGHNNLRGKIMGMSPDVPTPAQMRAMQQELILAMEAGCLGYSSGLVYTPSVYGTTRELIELASVMVPYGGIYATHVRGEGDQVLTAVREAIQIGEEAGVQVQLSHLKVMGKHNEGISVQLLQLIDEANARGVRVYADQYPYVASAASLSSRIPPKYHVGGRAALLERLKDPAIRKQIHYSIFHGTEEFESSIYTAGYDGSLITSLPKTPELAGKTVGQLAVEADKDPLDMLCDILLANGGVGQGIYFNQNDTDVHRILAHPMVFGGSDSANYPDTRFDPNAKSGRHPRAIGAMVRRLELQRDLNLCSPEEAIHRITGAPAAAFRLQGQGLLKEGYDASMVVLNYAGLHANATYEQPYLPNEGIDYVLLNGMIAAENGKTTGVRAGKVLKRTM